jgi:hypothetical protein
MDEEWEKDFSVHAPDGMCTAMALAICAITYVTRQEEWPRFFAFMADGAGIANIPPDEIEDNREIARQDYIVHLMEKHGRKKTSAKARMN